ncbi:hypothetical protein ACFWNE_06780 [Streptomyces goshikiensis]|uniref:hypothetical protein n=1 Tax=Streptomyces TaxID=1883 RepID=UPI000F3AA87B|nr:hypothetical protein [Streptomyces sp. ADI95-16]AYV29621.1 hypothetical protein EES41_23175 [Streptomyces sp. ADI95-16]
MHYDNLAYGYVPRAGFVRLEWNVDGRVKATRAFTGESMTRCLQHQEPIPPDTGPDELLARLAVCNDHLLFGRTVIYDPDEVTWGDDSMQRRARHGGDMGITSDDLLRLLQHAALLGRFRIDVTFYEAPAYWAARLWTAAPEGEGEFLGPVSIDAGDVRSMLRTADHLMRGYTRAESALVDLMQKDADRVTQFIDEGLEPEDAEAIMQFAVFGGLVLAGI